MGKLIFKGVLALIAVGAIFICGGVVVGGWAVDVGREDQMERVRACIEANGPLSADLLDQCVAQIAAQEGEG